jgi:hypothetical protein
MFIRRFVAAIMLAAGLVVLTGPAANAAPRYNYVGWSGGTLIHAVGSTLSSDLTAQSYVAGITVPKSAHNNVAAVEVGDIARTGEVETSERVFGHEDGVRLISKARTANVRLLGGLITADDVSTKNVTTASPTEGMSTTARTRYVNLHISGVDLPVDIPKNYKVQIPGIATIIINGQEKERHDGILTSHGYGLKIVLLSAFQDAGVKSVIILNPTFAGLAKPVPIDAPRLAGWAFGTRVHTSATSEVQIDSGKTANISCPPGGTSDATISNSTAAARVPRILFTGAVFSTARGLTTANYGEVTTTNEITKVSLLGGLVTADAIKVKAHATRIDNAFKGNLKMNFANLVIAGNEIPIDVSPNTTIKIGDLAKVIINKQVKSTQIVGITGIYIKLLKPRGDAPAGALIEIGQAVAWIPPADAGA